MRSSRGFRNGSFESNLHTLPSSIIISCTPSQKPYVISVASWFRSNYLFFLKMATILSNLPSWPEVRSLNWRLLFFATDWSLWFIVLSMSTPRRTCVTQSFLTILEILWRILGYLILLLVSQIQVVSFFGLFHVGVNYSLSGSCSFFLSLLQGRRVGFCPRFWDEFSAADIEYHDSPEWCNLFFFALFLLTLKPLLLLIHLLWLSKKLKELSINWN